MVQVMKDTFITLFRLLASEERHILNTLTDQLRRAHNFINFFT